LYLPRGCIHSAATSDSYSAHVTIGISVYTWSDLIQALVENSADDKGLRPALPGGFAKHTELKPFLKQRLTELLGHRTNDQLIESFTVRVRSGQLAPAERFRIDVMAIDENTPLQTPARSQYQIVRDAVSTVLEFRGKRHILPADLAPMLRAISERSIFRTAELAEHLPAQNRLGVNRYLLDIGFLTLAH